MSPDIVHNGEFDASGVSLEEAQRIEAQKNQSTSETSEQEVEDEQKEIAEDEASGKEEEKEEASETKTEEKESESDEEKEEASSDESKEEEESPDSDTDEELDALVKKQKGITDRKAKLQQQIEAEEKEVLELRHRKRSIKDRVKVAEEDVDSDYFSQEDKKHMDVYLRSQGYVKVSDLEKDNIESAKDTFIDSHSEYQDKKVLKELETYASIYKAPENAQEQSLILKRAHVDRLRDQQRTLKHSPDAIAEAKDQLKVASSAGGGGKGSRSPKQSSSGLNLTPDQRTILLNRGWTEEDLA